jgi:hypothetical protein
MGPASEVQAVGGVAGEIFGRLRLQILAQSLDLLGSFYEREGRLGIGAVDANYNFTELLQPRVDRTHFGAQLPVFL